MLVRSHMRGSGDKEQWLLIKESDDAARDESEYDVLKKLPGSVLDGSGKQTATKAKAAAKMSTKKIAHATAPNRARTADSTKTEIVATRSAQSLRELAASPSIEDAVKARLPATIKPQLATLVDAAPTGDEWLYEIKFDGYRVLTRIDHHASGGGPVRVFTRAGNDWSAKFNKQIKAFGQLELESGWLDGEAVVLDKDGVPSFQALQNAFDANRPQHIVIYLFDIPFLNGYDLRGVPLVQRRTILHALLEGIDEPTLRFSADFGFSADDLLKSACDMALEGIIGKRRDSLYTSGRSAAWIKLKCRRRQEFVIGGYSEPTGSRAAFGALLLGVHDEKGKLQYAGRVGTGFDAALLRSVKKELDAHASNTMSFARAPRERSRTPVHWVEPDLVCECNFAEWTDERIVRQASFVSLRRDKPAKQIVKEAPRKGADVQPKTTEITQDPPSRKREKSSTTPAAEPAKKNASKEKPKAGANEIPSSVGGVRISHPERVIDKSTKARKIDLVQYYESVVDWMLPHLQDRPMSLVRAPEGIGGELFFQKHSQKLSIPNVTQHPGLDPGHPPLITIESVQALIGAAQMGTIELHTWNAVASNIEKPDRVVFDLDPDASLGWDKMIEAAQLTRSLLEELGLVSF
ncbi:bifunctional non-homologous end joining protein LigD [Paraburkholderia sp. GAS334]